MDGTGVNDETLQLEESLLDEKPDGSGKEVRDALDAEAMKETRERGSVVDGYWCLQGFL